VEPSALLLLFVLVKHCFCFLEQRFWLRSSLRYFSSSGKLFPDLRSLVSVLENLSVSVSGCCCFCCPTLVWDGICSCLFFPLVKHVCIDFSEDDPSRIVFFSIS